MVNNDLPVLGGMCIEGYIAGEWTIWTIWDLHSNLWDETNSSDRLGLYQSNDDAERLNLVGN